MSAAPSRRPNLLGAAFVFTIMLLGSTDSAEAAVPIAARTAAFPGGAFSHLADIDEAESTAATPVPEPLTRERLIAMVQATWPEDPKSAVRVLICESNAGEHPDTYSLGAANGGPMQLNRYTWASFFEASQGWTWERVVTDIEVHLRAARIIYDRASGWSPWRCY